MPIGSSNGFVNVVEDNVWANFVDNWSRRINSDVGPSGKGRNKLRMYKLIKPRFITENYCKIILPPRHMAAFSKFRCGAAPLIIETGRYEG